MGKIIPGPVKKRSIFGDWSRFDGRPGLVGFISIIVGLAFLSSGKLDDKLIGLGIFGFGLGAIYWSVRSVWGK